MHALEDVGAALAMLGDASADVLVLDWDDPAYGAAAACAAVRGDPRLAATWMVAIVDRWGRAAAARREGADDAIVRPLHAPEIAARARLGVAASRARASDHLLRTLLTHVPGVLYRSAWDRGYRVELISDEIERITGYPAADFVERRTRTLLSIIHPDDIESVMARAAEATDGRSFVLEYRLVCADGTARWMIDRGRLVRGHGGRLWIDGVIVDVTDLREAEHALRPATLSERGLRPAVEALAARCPLPVDVAELPAARFGPGVEAAAYFTISEALTNVAKYAGAQYATVRGTVEHDALVVEVDDGGIGGADAAGGSGLTGLADRVRAQGGTLSVVSSDGGGTTVRAVIPLDTTA